MEFVREIEINSEEDTKEFGLNLSKELKEGDVLALIGDLGTGKTTLTKYIGEGLGVRDEINSPTFLIVKSYEGRINLNHFDIYRLHEEEDDVYEALLNIGFEEYVYSDDICVIEWADYIMDMLPEYTKYIYIDRIDESRRIYRCTF